MNKPARIEAAAGKAKSTASSTRSMGSGITTYTPERYNPRHRHNDEAVRFYYRGAECYGKDVLEEGDCVYVPEGVYYGPTKTAEKCDHNVRISLHFPGPSGFPTPVW